MLSGKCILIPVLMCSQGCGPVLSPGGRLRAGGCHGGCEAAGQQGSRQAPHQGMLPEHAFMGQRRCSLCLQCLPRAVHARKPGGMHTAELYARVSWTVFMVCIQGGGVRVNNERVGDEQHMLSERDLIDGRLMLIAAGKKNKLLLQVRRS